MLEIFYGLGQDLDMEVEVFMSNPIKIGQVITYKGEQWKVIGVGVTNPDNGKVYLHLAHTTKGVAQRNGFRPLQACDWVDLKEAAATV